MIGDWLATAWSKIRCRILGHDWFAHRGNESYCARPACRGIVYYRSADEIERDDLRIELRRQMRGY